MARKRKETVGGLEIRMRFNQDRARIFKAKAARLEEMIRALECRRSDLATRGHAFSEKAAGYGGIVSIMRANGYVSAVVENGTYTFTPAKAEVA